MEENNPNQKPEQQHNGRRRESTVVVQTEDGRVAEIGLLYANGVVNVTLKLDGHKLVFASRYTNAVQVLFGHIAEKVKRWQEQDSGG